MPNKIVATFNEFVAWDDEAYQASHRGVPPTLPKTLCPASAREPSTSRPEDPSATTQREQAVTKSAAILTMPRYRNTLYNMLFIYQILVNPENESHSWKMPRRARVRAPSTPSRTLVAHVRSLTNSLPAAPAMDLATLCQATSTTPTSQCSRTHNFKSLCIITVCLIQ